MPIDEKGRFHINSQKMGAARGRDEGEPSLKQEGETDGGHSELHAHGDGTYHTVHNGERAEHPSITHATAHLAGKHEPEGKHLHIHHDGLSASSSQAAEGGEVEGPHDHENMEALKEHMGQFLDEEEHEGAEHETGGARKGMFE